MRNSHFSSASDWTYHFSYAWKNIVHYSYWTYHFFFAFRTKNYLSEKVWYFIVVYIINITLHMAPWRYKISLLVLKKKYSSQSLGSLVKYFSKLEEKFSISASPCNNPYLRHILLRWVFLSTYIINWRASYTYCSVRGQKGALCVWG